MSESCVLHTCAISIRLSVCLSVVHCVSTSVCGVREKFATAAFNTDELCWELREPGGQDDAPAHKFPPHKIHNSKWSEEREREGRERKE